MDAEVDAFANACQAAVAHLGLGHRGRGLRQLMQALLRTPSTACVQDQLVIARMLDVLLSGLRARGYPIAEADLSSLAAFVDSRVTLEERYAFLAALLSPAPVDERRDVREATRRDVAPYLRAEYLALKPSRRQG